MKQTENAWARFRNVRLAAAALGMSLALLAMLFPARSPLGHGLLLASLAITAVVVLVLARRPDHQPNGFEILLPLATLGIVVLTALHTWR